MPQIEMPVKQVGSTALIRMLLVRWPGGDVGGDCSVFSLAKMRSRFCFGDFAADLGGVRSCC